MVRVLIGDDNKGLRDSLVNYLNLVCKVEVEEFASGEALIERAKTLNYAAVFTDYDYGIEGIINGIDVVRQIRMYNPDVPIYLVTGEFDAEEKFGSTPGLTGIILKIEGIEKIEKVLKNLKY